MKKAIKAKEIMLLLLPLLKWFCICPTFVEVGTHVPIKRRMFEQKIWEKIYSNNESGFSMPSTEGDHCIFIYTSEIDFLAYFDAEC